MTDKGIKAHLKSKVNDWLSNIENVRVKEAIRQHGIITGGAIVSLLQGESPKDYDIYFDNKETTKLVAEYYVNEFNDAHGPIVNKFEYLTTALVLDGDLPLDEQLKEHYKKVEDKIDSLDWASWGSDMLKNLEPGRIKIIVRSDGVASENNDHLKEPFEDVYDTLDEQDRFVSYEEALEKIDDVPAELVNEIVPEDKRKKPYRPIFLSSNAITLANKIQIVIRFYGTPEEIHKNYDFLHCTGYYYIGNGTLHYNEKILRSIMEKHLIYQGSKYPICSIIRTRKFINRGWHINAGQYLKMCYQISKLDLDDLGVLEDQLVGVDSAYFMVLIAALKTKMNNDPEFQISVEYVSSIIDKVFSF